MYKTDSGEAPIIKGNLDDSKAAHSLDDHEVEMNLQVEEKKKDRSTQHLSVDTELSNGGFDLQCQRTNQELKETVIAGSPCTPSTCRASPARIAGSPLSIASFVTVKVDPLDCKVMSA